MTVPNDSPSPNAFVDEFRLPPSGRGELDGLSFAVKENIDIAGHVTSCGSPAWKAAHQPATAHAFCVDQLLDQGAECVGTTVADEFTYSLDGENAFYGTPPNPRAPERVPGGSSSGSAAAVAGGLADFALGTDSGGSIRVPAGFCGIWGMRPSMHRVSEAGVLPFMPGVSTVGAFASGPDTLETVMCVLLGSRPAGDAPIRKACVLKEALDLADDEVRQVMADIFDRLAADAGFPVEMVETGEIVGEELNLDTLNRRCLRSLQSMEFQSTGGNWIEANRPELSPGFQNVYENVRKAGRKYIRETLKLREEAFRRINRFAGPGVVFLFPTTPTVAPLRGSLTDTDRMRDFYARTMAVTCFSGAGRLPEISIPTAGVDGIPLGLSVAAGYRRDEFLLTATRTIQRSAVR